MSSEPSRDLRDRLLFGFCAVSALVYLLTSHAVRAVFVEVVRIARRVAGEGA